VILVVTDDQPPESLSKMPYLSGSGDWSRFANAFLNNPLCCPSRATLLTGRYSHRTGVENNRLVDKFDAGSTLATWLDDAGYRTGLFGKYLNGYTPVYKKRGKRKLRRPPPGWDRWAAVVESTGGVHYNYTLYNGRKLQKYGDGPEDYSTDRLAQLARDFIADDDPSPFFLYLALRSPHEPYTPAPRHDGDFADEPIAHDPSFNEADVSDKPAFYRRLPLVDEDDADDRLRRQYEMLLSVDEAVESLVDEVEDRGLGDDTVVIFMTDNGFASGSHRWLDKRCHFEDCIRTPLLIRYPDASPTEIPQLVSNVDIAPTIADLAGVDPERPVDGRSLVPLLEGDDPDDWRTGVLLRTKEQSNQGSPPSFWGIRTDTHKYVEHATEEEELYDLVNDPYELVNLAGRPEHAALQAELARRLAELRAS
jgi:arylsulfatase A-like enzyme